MAVDRQRRSIGDQRRGLGHHAFEFAEHACAWLSGLRPRLPPPGRSRPASAMRIDGLHRAQSGHRGVAASILFFSCSLFHWATRASRPRALRRPPKLSSSSTLAARLGGDLRDAATHGAGADDADSGVVHCHLLEIFTGWVVPGLPCRRQCRCRRRCRADAAVEGFDFAVPRGRGVMGLRGGVFRPRGGCGRWPRSVKWRSAPGPGQAQLIQAPASLARSQPPCAAPTAWPV